LREQQVERRQMAEEKREKSLQIFHNKFYFQFAAAGNNSPLKTKERTNNNCSLEKFCLC
jgi:hypothetical protein